MTKIVLGSDYFPKFIEKDVLFIDKSLLIKQVIDDGSDVILITRPRRWGKSLDLSMIQHFFSPTAFRQSTQGMFDKLAIASVDNGHYMQYQGQNPAIFITLKDLHAQTYEMAVKKIYMLIREVFDQFPELASSDKLSPRMKKEYHDILMQEADDELIVNSLKILSECLYTHHGKKVYILIDEYDKPLNVAYRRDYFDELSNYMKDFLSAAFKTNSWLEKGIMTGILRLSKANMLSGLNNLQEYTLLDDTYAKYFGFTEEEVTYAFGQVGLTQNLEDVKAWYNGYKIGGLVIYNPWSIMNCIKNQGKLRHYWVDTADNSLIKKCLINSTEMIKQQLKVLLEEGVIEVVINRHVTFDNLTEDPDALWSLLLFAGYLRLEAIICETEINRVHCQVTIPNKEVLHLFNGFIISWFELQLKRINTKQYLQDLLTGDVIQFTRALSTYLMNAASVHDTGATSELFYHGFMLALVIQLKYTHHIRSNRESGLGRYDLAILPKTVDNDFGIILEFKHVKDSDQLETAAITAVQQIDQKQYDDELKQHPHIQKILRIGLAFSGKAVTSAYQTIDCARSTTSEVMTSSVVMQ